MFTSSDYEKIRKLSQRIFGFDTQGKARNGIEREKDKYDKFDRHIADKIERFDKIIEKIEKMERFNNGDNKEYFKSFDKSRNVKHLKFVNKNALSY